MIYKLYVKAKGNFSKHKYLGAPIRQDVKNCDNNSRGKKKTMTPNTMKIVKRKKSMSIKNSILYNILVNRDTENRKPLCIKLQRN